ncbi:MAG: hypothetical protein WCA32_23525 [Chromatiaceae bacterium]|jgi:hypothetical protein
MPIGGQIELEMDGLTLRPVVAEEVLISADVVHAVRNTGSTQSRKYSGNRSA